MSQAARSIIERDPVQDALKTLAYLFDQIDWVTCYAKRVEDREETVGLYVRQAAARHLRDLVDGPARGLRWCWRTARHMLDFYGFLRHSKGEWRGTPIELGPWQVFGLGCPFGWLRGEFGALSAKWYRRFKTAFWEVPKKNGKSTTLGGVGLYGLIGDGEPGADIYAAATKKQQARIVFDEARQMVLASPALLRKVSVYTLNLNVLTTNSKFEPLSSDANTGDGVNPHFAIIDEIHRLKTRALLTVFDQGMGARRQPMIWIITTAGDNKPGTPYDEVHEHARKILDGALEDDSFFALIFAPDEDDNWDDIETWKKANPNFGISVKLQDLIASAAQARSSPQALADFKRFRLNIRSSDADAAIKMEVWRRNHVAGAKLDRESLRGRKCHAAVDLSSKIDITCMLLLFPPVDSERARGEKPITDDDRWLIVPSFWVPQAGIEDRGSRDRAPYERWVKDKLLIPTLGNVVDYHAVKEALIGRDAKGDQEAKEGAKQMFRVIDVAYDPWNAGTLSGDVQEVGMQPFEFPQRTSHYAHPTKELLGMLLDGVFEHFDNPVLKWMASNLRLVRDHNDNPMPSKLKSTARIDGMSALIMALGRALENGDDGFEAAILRRGGL